MNSLDRANPGVITAGNSATSITRAVSRKSHGPFGNFDVDLLSDSASIECRNGEPTGDYQIVLTFSGPVGLSSASVTSGTANVKTAGASGSEVTINLTNVSNAQALAVTVRVNDGAIDSSFVVPWKVLAADTNWDGRVNTGDTIQTKLHSGGAVNSNNFRYDVNGDGVINIGDTNFVKNHAGTSM